MRIAKFPVYPSHAAALARTPDHASFDFFYRLGGDNLNRVYGLRSDGVRYRLCCGVDKLTWEILSAQAGGGQPTSDVIENELGNEIALTRDSAGTFLLSSDGKFANKKTLVKFGALKSPGVIAFTIDSASLITIKTYNLAGVLTDNLLGNTTITVEVVQS